jgi:hypothetical protein
MENNENECLYDLLLGVFILKMKALSSADAKTFLFIIKEKTEKQEIINFLIINCKFIKN